jgi:hypothetical protein
MANNRLWLVHRPTGAAICLGKRLAQGWWCHTDGSFPDRLNAFFEQAGMPNPSGDMFGNGPQDDFVLAIENSSGAPSCSEDWVYDKKMKPTGQFKLKGQNDV